MKKLLQVPWVRSVLALAFVFALGCIYNAHGAFLHWRTHRDMLRQVSVYGILGCGMTLVIIAGGIDLAVGSVLGLCAVVFAQLSLHQGSGAFVALGATLAVGAGVGAISGTLTSRFRIQPFIATLAMMVFARGLAKWLSGGQKISRAIERPDGTFAYADLPPVFTHLGASIWGGNLAGGDPRLPGVRGRWWGVVLAKLR